MALPQLAWVARQAEPRNASLRRLVEVLRADERFAAAWLIGGLARADQRADALSDLNVVAVVAPGYEATLCARPRMTAGHTTPDRLVLLRAVGEPTLIHENHYNASP